MSVRRISSVRRKSGAIFQQCIFVRISTGSAAFVLCMSPAAAESGTAPVEPGVLRLGGAGVSVFDDCYHLAELRLRPVDSQKAGSRGEGQASSGAGRGGQSGDSGIFQVCRILCPAASDRFALFKRCEGSGNLPAHRHFLLCVPVHELCD